MSLSFDEIQEFLQTYPGMTVAPATSAATAFSGAFAFAAEWNGVVVSDIYDLHIEVGNYPQQLPKVFETGGRIRRHADEHVFADTGALCLGSELRLRYVMGPKLNLTA